MGMGFRSYMDVRILKIEDKDEYGMKSMKKYEKTRIRVRKLPRTLLRSEMKVVMELMGRKMTIVTAIMIVLKCFLIASRQSS